MVGAKGKEPTIEIVNLDFFFPDGSSGLKDVSLSLPPGSRTLLIGGIFAKSKAYASH